MINKTKLRSVLSSVLNIDPDTVKVILETGEIPYFKTRAMEAIKKDELKLAIFLLGAAVTKQETEFPHNMAEIKQNEQLKVGDYSSFVVSVQQNPGTVNTDLRQAEAQLKQIKKIAACKHKFKRKGDDWVCQKCGVAYPHVR
jgi:uncharacterized protein YqfA (UPF0365 family)